MPSSITPLVSTALSQVVTPQPTARVEPSAAITPDRNSQAAQAVTAVTAVTVKQDRDRSPELIKKSEASYGPQIKKKKRAQTEKAEQNNTAAEEPKDPLDVVA